MKKTVATIGVGVGVFILALVPTSIRAQPAADNLSIRDMPANPSATAVVVEADRQKEEEAFKRALRRTHTYRLNRLDSRATGLTIAKAQAQASAFNELAGLIADEAEDGHALPDKEGLRAVLSVIARMEVVSEKWKDNELVIDTRIRTAPRSAAESIATLSKNQTFVQEMKTIRRLADQALGEIGQLQKTAGRLADQAVEVKRYDDAVKQLLGADRYEEARYQGLNGEDQKAIDAYSEAIEILPGLASAYRNRGFLYLNHLKDKARAIADFEKALPAYGTSAFNRLKSKDYDGCLEDVASALKLNDTYGYAYYLRAACSIGLGKKENVKTDFVKAAQLGDPTAQDFLKARNMAW